MVSTLKKKIVLGERDTLYVMEFPEWKENIRLGQFFEICVRNGIEPFLRRPVSVFDAEENRVSFLVRTGGKGTRMMSEWREGQKIDLLGPLGNGFQIPDDSKNILLAGGGIGAAPLHYLGKELFRQGKTLSMIFSPLRDREILKAFQIRNEMEILYSENRMQLPQILEQEIQNKTIDMICVCGPMAMMQTVVELAEKYQIPSQISLEARMGCGMGICMGCVVPIKNGKDDFVYKRVCHEGPVFRGEEVIFE